MALKCDTCGKKFLTNASLYMHKQTHNPSIVLMAHEHKDGKITPENDDYDGIGKKRNRNGDNDGRSPKRRPYPQYDPNLTVIDSYDDGDKNSPKIPTILKMTKI